MLGDSKRLRAELNELQKRLDDIDADVVAKEVHLPRLTFAVKGQLRVTWRVSEVLLPGDNIAFDIDLDIPLKARAEEGGE